MEYKRCQFKVRVCDASVRIVDTDKICLDIVGPWEAPNVVGAVVIGIQPDTPSSNTRCIGVSKVGWEPLNYFY